MPKSKRDRVVSLTQARKKDRAWKEGVVAATRAAADEFRSGYVFRARNMRNDKFKALRERAREERSRFCMGATRVLRVALASSSGDGDEADDVEQEEYRKGLAALAEHLKGDVGLFFTDLSQEEVESMFSGAEADDYARAGSRASETFELSAGPLSHPVTGMPLPHTLEPSLRAAGLSTKLDRGVVTLLSDTVVCRKGDKLSPAQAQLLRAFGQKQARFSLRLLARWDKESGEVEVQGGGEGDDDEESEDGDDGDGPIQIEV